MLRPWTWWCTTTSGDRLQLMSPRLSACSAGALAPALLAGTANAWSSGNNCNNWWGGSFLPEVVVITQARN
jgi:hypothetical protein